MICAAYVQPCQPKTAGEFLLSVFRGQPCGKPAKWRDLTTDRPLCDDCAERLVRASMSDETMMGMYLQAHGKRPASAEEARRRYLRPIQ